MWLKCFCISNVNRVFHFPVECLLKGMLISAYLVVTPQSGVQSPAQGAFPWQGGLAASSHFKLLLKSPSDVCGQRPDSSKRFAHTDVKGGAVFNKHWRKVPSGVRRGKWVPDPPCRRQERLSIVFNQVSKATHCALSPSAQDLSLGRKQNYILPGALAVYVQTFTRLVEAGV